MIKLHIRPSQTVETLQQANHYVMALDGYVPSAPYHLADCKLINFNHHENVDRLSTRATCSQVLISIRQGMMDLFRINGEITLDVYVNDCDQDVCLSWFLLKNHHLVENSMNPLINRLVHIEDMMDTCGGTYPFHRDTPVLKEIAWIFQPYTLFRLTGGIERKNVNEYQNVIDNVCQRIMLHITGNSHSIDLDINYNVDYRSATWSLVEEKGRDDRMAYWDDGIKAFIAYRKRVDGNYTYTVGKMSPFIDFNISGILSKLNQLEEGWGGSNTIGGSPRTVGSKINPQEIIVIVNNILSHK
jgi:hypothetical protein